MYQGGHAPQDTGLGGTSAHFLQSFINPLDQQTKAYLKMHIFENCKNAQRLF